MNLRSHLVHIALRKLTNGNASLLWNDASVSASIRRTESRNYAAADIDAPNGTNFLQLFVNDVSITTHALDVGIPNGLVPGNLVLIMPDQDIARDDRSPAQWGAS